MLKSKHKRAKIDIKEQTFIGFIEIKFLTLYDWHDEKPAKVDTKIINLVKQYYKSFVHNQQSKEKCSKAVQFGKEQR